MDPITLVALLGPLIKSGGQALINKFSGEFKPQTADDACKMIQAETEALKARKDVADTQEVSYPWVAAIVKLQRPIIVYGTITAFVLMSFFSLGSEMDKKMMADMASIVIFWLFGERTLVKLSK